MLLLPPAAWAHVSVSPDTAEPGERATVSFRVPNERDDATTVRLEVRFPEDKPLASVTPQTVPGWSVSVTTTELPQPVATEHGTISEAVTAIVWEGGRIPVGTYQDFPVSIASPPAGTLILKTLQTYSDGQVVRWIDVPQAGQAEPEHPAPTLSVAPPSAPASTSDTTARVLGGAGLAVGLVALGWAAIRRKMPAPAADERETIRV
ncbi:YcnI family protein [Amycolatopsis sp. ATCC 39116]|uniref:YcnI family copper-binding membrane protein n=1 Tax=Amycolatopsis sp. (strain ATCC 39116 / 75iv2) TaxID=385957 RepID=UPI0002627A18|nr:YcnI family protein [Amycolatopsis sp. ATCC 39116]